MFNKSKILAVATTTVMMGTMLAGSASAITLNFGALSDSSNTPATGASGVVELAFSSGGSGEAQVDATVTNTTGDVIFGAGATASVLTGFGFDLLDGISFLGSIDTGSFLDTVIQNADFQPFGTLDVAYADNSNFNGGNANDALPEGQSDTFSFILSLGAFADAAALESAFDTAFTENGLQAGLRFQQVNAGAGSDKLIFNPPGDDDGGGGGVNPVPLPAAGWMLLAALGGLTAAKRRRNTKA